MADVLAVRDEYRAQMWTGLIQECKASGMTNKDFCIQRGISEKSFYYWQRKFREQVVEAATPQLVQIETVSASTESTPFLSTSIIAYLSNKWGAVQFTPWVILLCL